MPEPVIVVDYDPTWPATFERLRERAWRMVGDLAESIEHIGSTSVPGLAAKPVIDMDVVVPTLAVLDVTTERLVTLGYHPLGTQGIEHRFRFRPPPSDPAHNLYVVLAGSRAHRNHMLIRAYLRQHADAAAEYAALKRQLATAFYHDRRGYMLAKADFILRILAELDFSPEDLAAIRRDIATQAPASSIARTE
jgi:GrpB-like predicted nucleotidyltransferase (UPF0157 family)